MTESIDHSIAPGLLVAVPQMADPNFARTVVYLVTLSDEGAFGLVLNRTAPIRLREVLKELELKADADGPVYAGGPVETNRGFLLYRGALQADATEGAQEVEPGILLSGAPEVLDDVAQGAAPFRLFLGYAGWGPGQLEQELSAGAWLAMPAQPEFLFTSDVDDLWHAVLRDAGIDPGAIGSAGGEVN